MSKRKILAAFGERIYEYHDEDGVVYYSFTRARDIISAPKRLRLQGRVGLHITRFLAQLRRLSETLVGGEGDAG